MIVLLAWLAVQNDAIFQEAGGRVVVEVELRAPAAEWKRETEMAGYSGDGYYTWRGGDLFGAPGRGVLSYAFVIAKPGVYHLRIRNRHDDADATLHNDCFTRMDGGEWLKTFSSERGKWTWGTNHEDGEAKGPAKFSMSAGSHVLEISGRSSKFSIDRIQLYRDGLPEEPAPAPSPTVLEAMAGPGPYGRHAAKLRAGRELGRLLASLRARPDGEDEERLLRSLSGYASSRLEEALALEAADPAAAVRSLERIEREFEGDEIGGQASAAAERLRRDPRVQAELRAEARWKLVEEGRARLRPVQGRRDLRSEGFRRLNGAALDVLRAQCEHLVRTAPDTVAAAKARDFLKELR